MSDARLDQECMAEHKMQKIPGSVLALFLWPPSVNGSQPWSEPVIPAKQAVRTAVEWMHSTYSSP